MKKLALALLALTLSVASASAQGITATQQIPIAGTVAASTRIITGTAGKQILVTGLTLIPVATSSVLFTTGTGTNCGTNTANLTGTMVFSSGQTLNMGGGSFALVIPTGNDVCITVATAAAPGSLTYTVEP